MVQQQDEVPWRKSIETPTAAPARKEDLSTRCKTCGKHFSTLQACLAHEMMHLTMGTKSKVDKKKRKRHDLDFSQEEETQEQKEFKLLVKTTLLICEEGNELNILCRLFQPNPENLNLVYDRVHFDLQDELNRRGKWEIEAFGSTITGMAFKWSDIDFYVENKNGNQPTKNTLQRVARILQASNRFSQVLSIHSARVPIIKCTHNLTGYSVDINVSSKFGAYNSKFIANVLSYDQRVHPLMLIIKIWANSWGLTKTGRITNYCLTWLVIFYLQNCRAPILPSVREFQKNISPDYVNGVNFAINMNTKLKSVNIQNIKEVVAGFFKFYVNYDFSSYVICPYSGKSISRSQFQTNPDALPEYRMQLELFAQNVDKNSPDFQFHPLNIDTLMVVQDPFVLNQNKSASVGPRVFTKFTKQLAKGHSIFSENPSRTPSSSTLLLQLFYEQQKEDKIADIIGQGQGEQKQGKQSADKKNQCKFSPVETELIYVRNYLRKNFPNQTFDKMEVNKFWTEKIVEFTGDVLQNYFKVTMSSLRKIGNKTARTVGQSDVYSNKYTVNCELSASVDNWSWRKNEIKRGYAAYLKEQMEITNRFDTERSTSNYPTNLYCTFCLKPENDFSAVNIIMEDLYGPKSGFKIFFTEFTVRMRNFYKALFEGLCRA